MCIKYSALKGFVFFIGTLICWIHADSAGAGILDNNVSMDEKPVEFNIGAAKYRIPRNYLYRMSNWSGGTQEYAAIRVTYPALQPFNKETKLCMQHKTACRIYEINLHNKFPVLEDGAFSKEESQHPELGSPGPYGFTLFTKGPENSKLEFYRKNLNGNPILFLCLPNSYNGKKYSVCSHATRTSSGITISYFFNQDELSDAVEVDESLKKLVDGFSIGNEK